MTEAESETVLSAIQGLDARLETLGRIGARVARVEDETVRLRSSVALRSDVAAVGTRIDGLGARIDVMAEQVAATSPRLRMVETSVGELRSTTARLSEVTALERTLGELSTRVEAQAAAQTARATRLSTQVTAWLVSLVIVVVGAMVSYALAMSHTLVSR